LPIDNFARNGSANGVNFPAREIHRNGRSGCRLIAKQSPGVIQTMEVQMRRTTRRLAKYSDIQATALMIAIITLGSGCFPWNNHSPAHGTQMLYGKAVPLGQGFVRSYVAVANDTPVELGIALSELALSRLPAGAAEYVLPLPRQAQVLPFRTFVLNWNPHGHVPQGVYDVPHFDFHFYTITDAARLRIVPGDPAFTQSAVQQPPPDQVPGGYTMVPEPPIPQMGNHWIDPASPEFHGDPFKHTFIFGTWAGRIIFYEPMVSLAFLRTRPEWTGPVSMAEHHDAEGRYPTAYRVEYNSWAREYRVAIAGMTQHH
jgi:hypothetical protein